MTSSAPLLHTSCPLCGPAPAGLIWEDAQLRVILVDDSPFPGYIRVIWRDHATEMTDLSPEERDHLMRAVYRVEALQRRMLQPDKINLASLGNQVPHLHWHLIPRWRSDPCFPDAIWAPARHDPALQAAWQRRAQELRSHTPALCDAITAALGDT
ncbi:HIT family protein [uncultured Castellaniella sp.]|uniref:HIT family protein n=1 Tax=uncultured Castellaniella sp. TaxID=647907 RepID=UPI00262556AF|nr:HIT family protein [uncultured Castellaniella sp.]